MVIHFTRRSGIWTVHPGEHSRVYKKEELRLNGATGELLTTLSRGENSVDLEFTENYIPKNMFVLNRQNAAGGDFLVLYALTEGAYNLSLSGTVHLPVVIRDLLGKPFPKVLYFRVHPTTTAAAMVAEKTHHL